MQYKNDQRMLIAEDSRHANF